MRLVLGVTLVLAGGCREQPGSAPGDALVTNSAVSPQASAVLYPSAPGSFVDLIDSAKHGVVGVRATRDVKSGPAAMFPGAPDATPDVALGTGFLIESHGVYVLTNDHIAAAAPELHVLLDDKRDVPAKIVGRDPDLDIALLSIETTGKPVVPLALGNSDQLRVGEWVVVLGNPFGDTVTASAGILSSTGHDAMSLVKNRTMTYHGYLQLDARVHRGNSGGPVIDTAGQVIGVAIAPAERPGELSFAIPINRVREVADALREHGQMARGWLGAYVKPMTLELAQQLGMTAPVGAVITEIKVGSPAARAGLRSGDVILVWGKTKVDAKSLPWLVAGTPINVATDVTVWRNKAEQRLQVATEKMPQ